MPPEVPLSDSHEVDKEATEKQKPEDLQTEEMASNIELKIPKTDKNLLVLTVLYKCSLL